jgi:hypothetical protein
MVNGMCVILAAKANTPLNTDYCTEQLDVAAELTAQDTSHFVQYFIGVVLHWIVDWTCGHVL